MYLAIILGHEGYDSSNIQFHPSGRILLTEYAKEVVSRGNPIAAVKLEDGIILAAAKHKLRSRLQLSGSRKVLFVDKHICIAGSGNIQALNPVVKVARRIALDHRSMFDESIPVQKLCDSLAAALHSNTISADAPRPVPLGLVVSGVDDTLGYQLYNIDPEGSVYGWNALALGKKSDELSQSLAGVSVRKEKLAVKTVWPVFKSHILRILKQQDNAAKRASEIGLNEEQKEFRSEYVQHHGESGPDTTDHSEWDLEGYVCLKSSEGKCGSWFAIDPSEWKEL